MAKKPNKDEAIYLQPTATTVGFQGCCPRCGQGRLYSGLLTPAKSCMNCSLDYSFIDSGDGPAVFVILIVGFVIMALAMLLHTSFDLPLWLEVLILIPVISGMCIWALRFAKGVMIALQYRTKAEQGVLQ